MKKYIALAALMLLCTFACKAQDIITTKDGEDISAIVTRVGDDTVEYKTYGDADGPTYTLEKDQVLVIEYANGERAYLTDPKDRDFRKSYLGEIRYKDIKYDYDARNYKKGLFDYYSRTWAGVGSALVPGLGQALDGEWGRAAGFFFGSAFLDILTFTNTDSNGAYAFAAANLALYVWGIVDAVHVAKVKNMYIQEITGRQASMDLKVHPYVAYEPHLGGTFVGMGFGVSF